MMSTGRKERFLDRDKIELKKSLLELPKVGFTAISFFAGISAAILKLDGSSEPVIFNFINYNWNLSKILFVIGVVLSVISFLTSYNYMASVVSAISKSYFDDDYEVDVQTSVRELVGAKYINMKAIMSISVFWWFSLLTFYVVVK